MKNFIKRYWFSGLLILIISFGLYSAGVERGKTKELLKQLDEKEQIMNERLDEKAQENERLSKENVETEKAIAKVTERLSFLEAERALDKDRIANLEERARQAPPESLIADMRKILESEEIWLTEQGVVMSMDAFRKMSFKMYDWQDFTLKREPNYLETIEQYKIDVYLLQGEVSNLKLMVKNTEDMVDIQAVFNEEMRDVVGELKPGFWNEIKKIGTGIAIGAGLVLVFGK